MFGILKYIAVKKTLYSYSSQVWSYKWWHHIFFFLLDLTMVNMYIIYLHCLQNVDCSRAQQTPMTHLQFKIGLCDALLKGRKSRDVNPQDLVRHLVWPVVYTPTYSKIPRPCLVCHVQKPHFFCYKCDSKWMCLKKGCFERWHTTLYLRRQHQPRQ